VDGQPLGGDSGAQQAPSSRRADPHAAPGGIGAGGDEKMP
jgi:hypothetical protein